MSRIRTINTHVLIKIYREFYHGIIYMVNEERHIRIKHNLLSPWYSSKIVHFGVNNNHPLTFVIHFKWVAMYVKQNCDISNKTEK
jgi:hypothetical protein